MTMPTSNSQVKSAALHVVIAILWLGMMSVTLIESDFYRYAAILLMGLSLMLRKVPLRASLTDWLAILCVAWGALALSRFLFGLIVDGERGASEWLYAFAIFFPAMGLALHTSWNLIKPILLAFFCSALVLFIVSTPFSAIVAGERISPAFHHNSIHAAVGCGFIFIGAFYWALHQWEIGAAARTKAVVSAIAVTVIGLAIFNIYGAKSKGVWLALLPALGLMTAATLFYLRRKTVLVAAISGLLLLSWGVYEVRDNVAHFGAATFNSVVMIVERLDSGVSLERVMQDAIASSETPQSLDERLQLWANAIDVISAAPAFGSGNSWLTIWQTTPYRGVTYTLMHNGYLEILVRYGFTGLAILALIVISAIYRVYRASAAGVISKSAFACYLTFAVYFAFTILSNSNNRLALGESYALLFAATCFACSIRLRAGSIAQRGTVALPTGEPSDAIPAHLQG
ncbi:O-antigen ligase family protein (plasmid) [Rhizobium sp. T1470]|uniref:O-antigen ligase family protein n=1 Tax=unclassified Rhizobium TaxID=2613769 RepID=UPI001AAE477F|nr:O-antigen ligase family protein [Rhizobium sp. T1473]MCA0805374.1 O-antigen ligase family protein [Rhizobium sp. T1473]